MDGGTGFSRDKKIIKSYDGHGIVARDDHLCPEGTCVTKTEYIIFKVCSGCIADRYKNSHRILHDSVDYSQLSSYFLTKYPLCFLIINSCIIL